MTLVRVTAGLLLWLDTEQTGDDVMAPNGHGIDNPHEWRGTGEAGWRVEMLAKDEQIRSLTARLAEAEARADTMTKALVTAASTRIELEQQLTNAKGLLRRCLYECDWKPRHNALVDAIARVPNVKDVSHGGT